MQLPLLVLCFQSVLDVEGSTVQHAVLIQIELVGMQFVEAVVLGSPAADEGIDTGGTLQEVGEVLTAGSTGEADQMLLADGVFYSPLGNAAAALIGDGSGQIHVVVELIGRTVCFAGTLDDPLDLLRQGLAHLGIEGTDSAAEFRVLGDDVGAGAAVEGADADHNGIVGVCFTAGDALQSVHNLAANVDGVNRAFGHGTVTGTADDLDVHEGRGGIPGTGIHGDGAGGQLGEDVHTGNGIQIVHQTAVQNAQSAVHGFFRGLEDELHGAVQFIPVLRQNLCRGQQHGNVRIMAAGMHDAFILGLVGKILDFLDGQRVDISTQTNHGIVTVTLQCGNGAGLANCHIGNVQLIQFFPDPLGGAEFFPAYFRILVELSAERHSILPVLPDQFHYIHEKSSFVLKQLSEGAVAGLNSDEQEDELQDEEQAMQRQDELVPLLQGNLCQAQVDQQSAVGEPEGVGDTVAVLECQNSSLTGDTQHISQRHHDGHNSGSLAGAGGDQSVDEEVCEEHAQSGDVGGSALHQVGQAMDQGVDQAAGGHGPLNSTGNTDDGSADEGTLAAVNDQVDGLFQADLVQQSNDDAADQEGSSHLGVAPAPLQDAEDVDDDGNNQNQSGQLSCGSVFHVGVNGDDQRGVVDVLAQGTGRIFLDLLCIAQGPDQGQQADEEQGDDTQLPAGEHGQFSDGVGGADSEHIEGSGSKSDQAGEAGDSHTDQSVITQGNCQGDDDGNEGDDVLGPAQDAAEDEENNHDDADDNQAVVLLGSLQNAVDQSADNIGVLVDLNNTGDQHDAEHHVGGSGQTFGDGTEHVEQADGSTLNSMVAVSDNTGHAVDGFTVISAGCNEIGNDGAQDDHEEQGDKGVHCFSLEQGILLVFHFSLPFFYVEKTDKGL